MGSVIHFSGVQLVPNPSMDVGWTVMSSSSFHQVNWRFRMKRCRAWFFFSFPRTQTSAFSNSFKNPYIYICTKCSSSMNWCTNIDLLYFRFWFRCFLWLYNCFQKLWAIVTRSSFQTPLRVASKTQDLWLHCDTWAESAHIWGPVPLQFSLIKDTRAKKQITKSGPLQKPHLTRTTAENQSDYKEKGENVLFNPNKTEISYIYR